jgi:AhpC/TSA family/Disulphide bond corrector protein DsbC
LEKAKEVFRKNGLGACAISYDKPDILRRFARAKNISIPLLSDPDSRIIRDFSILNTTIPEDSTARGIPFHGTFLVDEAGVVVSKFFDENSKHSMGPMFTQLFGSSCNTHQKVVERDNLALKYYASSDSALAGDRVTLIAELSLNENVHIYAPSVKNYLPLELELISSSGFSSYPVKYPLAKTLYLPVIRERVPVYRGTIQLSQRIIISSCPTSLLKSINRDGDLLVQGTLRYQACDTKICYVPQKVSLQWKIKIAASDGGPRASPIIQGYR